MNKNQLQQGDVLIEKMNDEFFNKIQAKKICQKKNNKYILAEGEVTGHCHAIEDKQNNTEMFEYYDDELQEKCLLLKILDKQVKLKHEEHKEITLDKGIFRVSKLNEYDPFENFTKKVQD